MLHYLEGLQVTAVKVTAVWSVKSTDQTRLLSGITLVSRADPARTEGGTHLFLALPLYRLYLSLKEQPKSFPRVLLIEDFLFA